MLEKYTGMTIADVGEMTQTQIHILASDGKPAPPGRTEIKNPTGDQLKKLVAERRKAAGL